MTPHEAAEVLYLFEQAEDNEGLYWRVDMLNDRDVFLAATCSDYFSLATADAEEITAEDFPLLRQTLADLLAVDAGYELGTLFAARKRKMRPLPSNYEEMEAPVREMYDACCTAEERAAQDRKDAAFWGAVGAMVAASVRETR